ncbi:MAG: glycosyltransferase, partial [Rhizobiales bacterium]|nr:glycosyltransferase [Hyphomicrobiales bacterium]
YRDNRAATAAVVAMLAYHWKIGTWQNNVDRYIALTEFSKQKFIEGGLPAEKISVKPNFVRTDPGPGSGSGNYAIFVGRLSAEKGIQSLLDAWQILPGGLELKILGDGPLADQVAAAAAGDRRIEWLGRKSTDEVFAALGDAKFLIMPSVWYETFGLTMIEAYAKGTPVIASRLGAMTELVTQNETGFLYEPGQAPELVKTIQQAIDQPDVLRRMRGAARSAYERNYSAAANYGQLIKLYERVIEDSRG